MSNKYLYIVRGVVGLLIIIGFMNTMNTKKLLNELHSIQEKNDKCYIESLELLTSAMSIDYQDSTEENRLYYFTQVHEKIGMVESFYPYTSYYDKNVKYMLELAIKELKVYFNQQWLNNFKEYEQTQIDVYNLIINIILNPEDSENINALYDFLVQYNKFNSPLSIS